MRQVPSGLNLRSLKFKLGSIPKSKSKFHLRGDLGSMLLGLRPKEL